VDGLNTLKIIRSFASAAALLRNSKISSAKARALAEKQEQILTNKMIFNYF
jgi:hypothetical protein